MTTVIAWVNGNKKSQELVFASDSRLSGGSHVDTCQKIFPLPRGDCALAFAGATAIAYPFILQVVSVISNHQRILTRSIDFNKIPSIVARILNKFIDAHRGYDRKFFLEDLRGTEFIIGGWSAELNKFQIRRLKFDRNLSRYIVVRNVGVWKIWGLKKANRLPIAFAGDYFDDLMRDLGARLRSSGALSKLIIGYEPLYHLNGMLLDKNYTDRSLPNRGRIGGYPQIVKVLPNCQSFHLRVERESNPGAIYFQGRPMLSFEKITNPLFKFPTNII